MVKSWMKNASGLKVQQLDIQQQALKLTANRFVFIVVFCDLFSFALRPDCFAIQRILSSLYIADMLTMQYVWMSWVFQLKILCKASCRAYNTTSKRNICHSTEIWNCLLLTAKTLAFNSKCFLSLSKSHDCAGKGDSSEHC